MFQPSALRRSMRRAKVGVRWVNPHIHVVLEASDDRLWEAEGIGRTYMKQRGIYRDTFRKTEEARQESGDGKRVIQR